MTKNVELEGLGGEILCFPHAALPGLRFPMQIGNDVLLVLTIASWVGG